MTRAEDELKKRKAEEEAGRIRRLALLAFLFLFLAAAARRPLIAFALARFFAPLTPAGVALGGGPRTPAALNRASNGLQDYFEHAARALAFRLEETGALDEWRRSMNALIVGQAVGQRTLAAGRALLPSEALDVLGALRFEFKHLEDFESELRRRLERAADPDPSRRPFSARYVAARAALYSGSARGVFFRADERGQARNVVIDYRAVDDRGTCSPCLEAEEESPYLPGEGPMPGEVCRGRGRCRCLRIPRDSPRDFERLTKLARGNG